MKENIIKNKRNEMTIEYIINLLQKRIDNIPITDKVYTYFNGQRGAYEYVISLLKVYLCEKGE